MNREIKFRAWHKKEKRWLDPWAEEDPMLCFKDFVVCTYDRKTGGWISEPCVVLQQYTGLKDKNGTEIYEGDLLKDHFLPIGNKRAGVCWDNASCSFGLDGKFCGGPLFSIHTKHYEVVGNIFEGERES